MGKITLTAEEIIATLNHSQLPTLLAEGRDDIIALRRLEDIFASSGLSVLPVGGRRTVLDIYDGRDKLSSVLNISFLADLDIWIYSEIPAGYLSDQLLFTDGYSIENDLYRDGELERYLTGAERAEFEADLERFLHWYVLMLARALEDGEATIALHPAAILDDPARFAVDCALLPGESYPARLLREISVDYAKMVRGKSLLALLLRRLSARRRVAKHSAKSLLEHGAVAGGPLMQRICDWMGVRLAFN